MKVSRSYKVESKARYSYLGMLLTLARERMQVKTQAKTDPQKKDLPCTHPYLYLTLVVNV